MSSKSICMVIQASCSQCLSSFRHVMPPELFIQASFYAKATNAVRCLATLGNTALDVVPFDIIGVVGLDVGGETVQSALDRFLGGRVHHAGLSSISNKFLI